MSHLTHDSRLTLTKSPPPSPHSSPLSLLRLSSLQNVSIGALFLAAKVEESPRKVRDVLNVYHHLEQKRGGVSTPAPLDVYSSRYNQYKERLVRAEREILKELGFILYCEHPHKFILNYVKLLTADSDTCGKLAQYAWNFINDSQRTNLCTKYAPEVICCAAIWMAARVLHIKLPSSDPHPMGKLDAPPWWERVKGLFDVVADPRELHDLQDELPDVVAALAERHAWCDVAYRSKPDHAKYALLPFFGEPRGLFGGSLPLRAR